MRLRFTVSDGRTLQAATWKCWSQKGKSDVYLACRELRGSIKASLHESGSWHFAYEKPFFARLLGLLSGGPVNRFIDRWRNTSYLVPGVVLAIKIITPWTAVTEPYDGKAPLITVPPPPEGQALEISVLLVDPGMLTEEWPGKCEMATSLLGNYALPNGKTVWLVWRAIAMPMLPSTREQARLFPGASRADLKKGRLKVLAFADGTHGEKVFYDCAAEWKGDEASA